ncbi:MAG TPA: phosphomannose isomerase type II C-terminal cupin domain [Syntrophales bacterium]|nr:phosphomannose isomerase type II C-terminal cupin domain [Syntrophales bacterium]
MANEMAGETDRRPWGFFVVLSDEKDHKVKRLVVHPGARISLQRHEKRREHWFVIRGEGRVTRDGEERVLKAGESTDIPLGGWHRVENTGTEDLVFIEVQTGASFEENDIERRDDDYGRV